MKDFQQLSSQDLAEISRSIGLKHDTGKPDFSLISPIASAYLAQVLTFGAKKYAAHNWRKGIPMSKLLAASDRHLTAIKAGIDKDPETGLPHAAHLMCECMFMIEQMASPRADEFDDRFKLTDAQRQLVESLLATATN